MKKRYWPAVLVALVIISSALLSGCKPGGTVVGKVGNETILARDVDMYVNFLLLQYGQTRADVTSEQDMKDLNASALEMAVDYKLFMQKGKEKKVYPLSDADQKEIDDTINSYIQQRLDPLVESYTQQAQTDKAVNPQTAAQRELDKQMKEEGLTKVDLTLLLTQSKVAQLLMDDANKAVTVTDEDVKATYDQTVEEQKQSYTQDAANYENDLASGVIVSYKPEGYRYVKHILISFPEDVSTQISDALGQGDTETVKKLRDENLPKIKPKADDVLAKVKSGEDFDTLMAQYGEDPGMKEEPASKTGYELGSATSFVDEFKQAALALAKVGDTTDLVPSDFGYHIIKWVGNVPSGPVPFDNIKTDLKDQALQQKQNDNWNTVVEQWKTEVKVEQYPDKIPVVMPTQAPVTPTAAG